MASSTGASGQEGQSDDQGGDGVATMPLPFEVWERILVFSNASQIAILSLVSRQHLAITRSISFRARFFCTHAAPCQAIYNASCRPKLFTRELIKCMLSQGATMSRFFIQSLLQRSMGVSTSRPRSNSHWALSLPSSVVTAVLEEGQALYGDSLKLSVSQTDGSEVRAWSDSPSRIIHLASHIREIFVTGKFAIFSEDENCFAGSHMALWSTLAYHPKLIKILMQNGYVYGEEEQLRIVGALMQRHKTDEGELYKQLDKLLVQFPNWNTKVAVNTVSAILSGDFVRQPCVAIFSPVAMSETDRTLLVENEGVGPIHPAFKVMKRLYDEGRAFLDMDKVVELAMEESMSCPYRKPPNLACSFRIFTHAFPHVKSSRAVRQFAAMAYVCAFERDQSSATAGEHSASDVAQGHEALFRLFEELGMDAHDLAAVLVDEQIAYNKLIVYAIKENKVAHFHVEKRTFLGMLLRLLLVRPMTGHKLEEIELAMREVFATERGGAAKRTKRASAALAEDLSKALMEWEFDLEALKPDRRQAVESKMRSPIAWMVKGTHARDPTVYCHSFTMISDIHGLFPPLGRPRLGNDVITLPFIDLRGAPVAEEEEDGRGEAGRGDKADVVALSAHEPNHGWKHLGHIDQLAMADDSGIAMVEEEEAKVAREEGGEEGVTGGEEAATPAKTTTTVAIGRATVWTKRASMWTYNMQVLRSHCVGCLRGDQSCCYDRMSFHPRAKQLALSALLFLPSWSSALRDVVLAHALFNGNEEVVQMMMSEAPRKEGEDDKRDGQAKAGRSSARLGPPELKVLPTLAHLRILQAMERKPMTVLVDAIAKGAPFKRGHVKSSLPLKERDRDWVQRDKWSEATIWKNDRPMHSLFAEKSRLEAMDKERKKRRGREARKGKGRQRRSNDDEEALFNPASARCSTSKAESSVVCSRRHLARSARRAVRYVEDIPLSSEDEEGEEERGMKRGKERTEASDVDERQVLKTLVKERVGSGRKAAGQAATRDESSEMSELSECNEEEAGDDRQEGDSEASREASSEDKGEGGLDREAVLLIDLDSAEEKGTEITLAELKRRCKSMSLWIDHLKLLAWFERRKEMQVKEKAKTQADRQRYIKGSFAKALNEMLDRLPSYLRSMNTSIQDHMERQREALERQRSKEVREAELKAAELKRIASAMSAAPWSKPSKRRKTGWEEDQETAITACKGANATETRGATNLPCSSPGRPRKLIKVDSDLDALPPTRKKRGSAKRQAQ